MAVLAQLSRLADSSAQMEKGQFSASVFPSGLSLAVQAFKQHKEVT